MNIISHLNPRSLITPFQSDAFVFSANSFFDSLNVSKHTTREFTYKATGLTLLTGGLYAIVSRSFLLSPLLAGAFFLYANSKRFCTEAKLRDPVYFNHVKAEVEKIKNEESEASAIVFRLPESVEDLHRYNLLSDKEAELFLTIEKATVGIKEAVKMYKAPLQKLLDEIGDYKLHRLRGDEAWDAKEALETWLGGIEEKEPDAFKTSEGLGRLYDRLMIDGDHYFSIHKDTYFLRVYFFRRDQYNKIEQLIDYVNNTLMPEHAQAFNGANDEYEELRKKEAKSSA